MPRTKKVKVKEFRLRDVFSIQKGLDGEEDTYEHNIEIWIDWDHADIFRRKELIAKLEKVIEKYY